MCRAKQYFSNLFIIQRKFISFSLCDKKKQKTLTLIGAIQLIIDEGYSIDFFITRCTTKRKQLKSTIERREFMTVDDILIKKPKYCRINKTN